MKKFIAAACVIAVAVATPALARPPIVEPDNLGNYATWDFTTADVEPAGLMNHTSGAEGTFKFGVLNAPDGTFKIVKTKEDYEEMSVNTSEDEYFSAQTPFGSAFGPSGPSTNVTFLKVRADGSAGVSATTTFTFESAMPADVFGAAFGDLDFDALTVGATDGSGADVSGANLNGATFNLCNVTDSIPVVCSGATLFTPTWDAAAKKFNVDENDSDGATGTITPKVSIKSLTTLHETASPSSSVRTWFAVKSATVCGTVSGLAASTATLTLSFNKKDLATVTTGDGGTYCFAKALAVKGYTLKVQAPEGMEVKGKSSRSVDLDAGNKVVDFTVQVPPATTTTTVAKALPATGSSNGDSTVVYAALALMSGLALTATARIRRARR